MLSDDLAVQRTRLANERTWLAYVRTGLTFFVAGVSFIQFFSIGVIRLIGCAFVPMGLATIWLGYGRYRRSSRLIREMASRGQSAPSSTAPPG